MKHYATPRRREPRPAPRAARGFSLMEVMVATIVICVGLLGIAKLQALALSNVTTSRLRGLAAIQAASLAAAMHSNRQYWANTPPATVTVNTAGVASTDAGLAAQANTYLAAMPTTACFGTSGGGALCAALQLAAFDVARWSGAVTALLPNPTSTVACPPAVGAAPVSCTIQIQWTEKAVASNKAEDTAAANAACTAAAQCFETPTYTLYVEP